MVSGTLSSWSQAAIRGGIETMSKGIGGCNMQLSFKSGLAAAFERIMHPSVTEDRKRPEHLNIHGESYFSIGQQGNNVVITFRETCGMYWNLAISQCRQLEATKQHISVHGNSERRAIQLLRQILGDREFFVYQDEKIPVVFVAVQGFDPTDFMRQCAS